MTGIFGILKSSATQWYQDVASTRKFFFFSHRPIYSLWSGRYHAFIFSHFRSPGTASGTDATRCFHCGGCLISWEPSDDPWVEHAKWFPHCRHVMLVRGKDFIDRVLKDSVSCVSSERSHCFSTPSKTSSLVPGRWKGLRGPRRETLGRMREGNQR
jgi:hypothetical protein